MSSYTLHSHTKGLYIHMQINL